jgi:hypothetical protein
MPIKTRILGGGIGTTIARLATSGTATIWRMQMVAVTPAAVSFLGLEMASSPGGANLCVGGTPSGGPEDGTFVAANAFDQNNGTRWSGSFNLVAGNWLQYEFTSPQTITEVRITTRNDAFFTDAPTVFAILSSNDGVNFTFVQLVRIGSAWTQFEQRAFAITPTPISNIRANASIWGITVTDSADGNVLYMAEMILATSIGGATIVSGGFPFHTTAINNSEASSNLFDGTNSLYGGRSFASVPAHSVGYVFASPVNPVELRLTAASVFSLETRMAKDFTIWWSANGYDRTTVATVAGQTGWSSGETRAFTIP